MRVQGLMWKGALLMAAAVLPIAVLSQLGRDLPGDYVATADSPSATPSASSSATPKDPTPPSITAVIPSVGKPGEKVTITLQGKNFGRPRYKEDPKDDPTVTFGPQGAGPRPPVGELPSKTPGKGAPMNRQATAVADAAPAHPLYGICEDPRVLSDTLLQCTLPSGLPAGQAQRFMVTVVSEGKYLSSDVSTATYTPVEEGQVATAAVGGTGLCAGPKIPAIPLVQVHLFGAFFPLPDGAVPVVTFTPTPGDAPKKTYACQNVLAIGSSELFCSLPRRAVESTRCDAKKEAGLFKVTYGGVN